MSKFVYGATEAVTYHNGVRIVVHIDEPWAADDPAVKACPDLFRDEPLDPRGTVTPSLVEKATATPGDKRLARRGN